MYSCQTVTALDTALPSQKAVSANTAFWLRTAFVVTGHSVLYLVTFTNTSTFQSLEVMKRGSDAVARHRFK